MTTIRLKSKDWKPLRPAKSSDVVVGKEYGATDGQFVYSPDGRYAAFKLTSYETHTRLFYVVDLFTQEFTQYTASDGMEFEGYHFHFYWLNDCEMMIYLREDWKQRQYRCRIDHLYKKLHKIVEHVETVETFWRYENATNGVLRFRLHDQDFLIRRQHGLRLVPYAIKANVPKQQNIITVTRQEGWSIRSGKLHGCLSDCFGYKGKLYGFLEEYGWYHIESTFMGNLLRRIGIPQAKRLRGLPVDKLFCFDLTAKKVVKGNISLNEADMTFFEPQKISPGTFRSEKTLSFTQQGNIIIITEHQPNSLVRSIFDREDRFWILNIEKETIQERIVQTTSLSRATLYQEEWIMLWSYPMNEKEAPTKIKYKQILRTDIVPRLKSICSAKLLSQKGIEKNKVTQRFINQ